MDLSIVVPVKDGAATLPACLDALLRVGAVEIVVVDDGSADDTAAIASRYPVTLLRHPANRGTSAARNTGWRATRTALVAFVDADVVVEDGALARLVTALTDEVVGANGIFSLDRTGDFITDFANLSIHYQHLSHGTAVASAFTSICVLRRTALEAMDGWDERFFSRYADDVATRFVLPPGAIRLDPTARARHLKRVPLGGLLRHRYNIGWFYVRSMRANRDKVRADNAVLALRYPLNTAVAALSLVAPPAALGFLVVNAPFGRFVQKTLGTRAALAAVGLSAAEGYAYLFGIAGGVILRG